MGEILTKFRYQQRHTFAIRLLSPNAKCPRRVTPGAAAFDVYCPMEFFVPPYSTVRVPLDISVIPPAGCYVRTVSRTSLAVYRQIFSSADVVDPDYTGCLHMVLTNVSQNGYKICRHERIGAIVFEKFEIPRPRFVLKETKHTERGCGGFGSTGKF